MGSNHQKYRIVIAEDSLTQAELLKHILEEKDFEVHHGSDGDKAFELIREINPDLVISDVMMPGMNGYELCKIIKKDKSLAGIPVLLLTTLTEPEDILIGLECGADSYLMKPYNEDLLLEKVERLISARETEVSEAKRISINFQGRKYKLVTSRERILDMMVTTYRVAQKKNQELAMAQRQLHTLKNSLEKTVDERTADLQKLIDERRKMEECTKDSEQKYRKLLENALLAVFVCDQNGRIQHTNTSFLTLLGLQSNEEASGLVVQDFMPDGASWMRIREQLHSSGSLQNQVIQFITNKRETRWAMLNISLTQNTITGIMLDISSELEMKQKEKENHKALMGAKEKAEKSERQKSRFLYNMSHEIKTPLNAITGFSGLAVDPSLVLNQRKEYISHVYKNSQLLSRVINNILLLAKLEAGKITPETSVCKLDDLMKRVELEFEYRKAMLGSGIPVRFLSESVEKDLPVATDQNIIVKVFNYLLENALQYTREGAVEVGFEAADGQLKFRVQDNGTGMTREQAEEAFERFQKFDSPSRSQHVGLGLGLTISKQLVDVMKGRIWIESEPGNGSCVRFTIPFKAPRVEKNIESVPERAAPKAELTGRKILVAEDNPMNFMLIKAYLEGYQTDITWAKDGELAVEICTDRDDFDIVLMDIQMPKLDGCEAAAQIRKVRPDLPIIAVTAFNLSEMETDTARDLFREVLNKPVSETKLTGALIRNLLNSELVPV